MERQTGTTLYAQIGVAAIAVVAILVGGLFWLSPETPNASGVTQNPHEISPSAVVSQPETGPSSKDGGAEKKASVTGGETENRGAKNQPSTVQSNAGTSPKESDSPQPETPVVADDKKDKTVYPTFDLVRIEPNGDNTFAARVAPGATVEMVRDGQIYARAVADTSGLVVITAPSFPVGASTLYLQSIAPDGRRETSRENVTVMISRDKTQRPLVAIASPDKPTVVLSNPDNPDSRSPATTTSDANVSSENNRANATSRPSIQLVSVEANDGGRLFVSGLAAPGSSVKLYLNGTMVAPGGADSEGKLSFSIARGMVAGDYLVRLDDVDPISGQVKSTAQVHFKIPDELQKQATPREGGQPNDDYAGASSRPSHVAIPSVETATVARGDSLWRISQRHYGSGYLYLELYDANSRKIRDPNMIFPGQVLVLPPLEMPSPP